MRTLLIFILSKKKEAFFDLVEKKTVKKNFFPKKRFSRITFFRKVMKTTFHYESFIEFYSAHFGINIDPCFIKKILSKKFDQKI